MGKNWWHKFGYGLMIGLGLLLAFYLRLVKLDQVPAGLTVDEVNYGYIAYSLAQTGKDEHGVSWPLLFQAYGDQKLPGQVYAILPLVAGWGLNAWTTRLPSALMSCTLILLIYWLIRAWRWPRWVAVVTALAWTVSPAPFILGRGAWESNLALAGLVFGLIGLGQLLDPDNKVQNNWKNGAVWWWALGFAWAWYCYAPYRVVSLVVWGFVGVGAIWASGLWHQRRCAEWLSIALGLVMIAPLLLGTRTSTGLARLRQVGGDQLTGLTMEIDEKRTFCTQQGQMPRGWCDLVYNKATLGVQTLGRTWLATLGIDYLALSGESEPMYHVAGFGLVPLAVYLVALIALIPLSLSLAGGKPVERRLLALLIILLVVTSVTPAILMGAPQKVRLSALLVPIFLLFAWGLDYLWQLVPEKLSRGSRYGLVIVIVIASGLTGWGWVNFMTTYYGYHYFKNDWQTLGHVARIDEILAKQNPDRVYWHVNYPDVLMFYAYDTAMDPHYFQEKVHWGEREEMGWQHAVALGDKYFQSEQSVKSLACDPEASRGSELTLFVEQDGELIAEIDRYLQMLAEKNREESLGDNEVPPAWAVRSINGANLLAYVVDLDWYRNIWCKKEMATRDN